MVHSSRTHEMFLMMAGVCEVTIAQIGFVSRRKSQRSGGRREGATTVFSDGGFGLTYEVGSPRTAQCFARFHHRDGPP